MYELDDRKLVESVKNFSYIYDRTTSNYKNKNAKQDAWKTISVIMNMNSEDCEQRWNVLRTRYNTEVREMTNKICGSESGFKRKWHLFDDMSFLDAHIVKRKTKRTAFKRINEYTETESQLSIEHSNPYVNVVVKMEDQKECEIENLPGSIDLHYTNSNDVKSPIFDESAQCETPNPTSESDVGELRHKGINNKEQNKIKTTDSFETVLSSAVQSINNYFKYKESQNENGDMCFSKYVYYSLLDIQDINKKNRIKFEITRLFLDDQQNNV